jgi:hypothetical protein
MIYTRDDKQHYALNVGNVQLAGLVALAMETLLYEHFFALLFSI